MNPDIKPGYDEKGKPVCDSRCPECGDGMVLNSPESFHYCQEEPYLRRLAFGKTPCIPFLRKMYETEKTRGDALAETLEATRKNEDALRAERNDARMDLCMRVARMRAQALDASEKPEHLLKLAEGYAEFRGWEDLFEDITL